MANMLAGSGPQPGGPSSLSGPPAALQGTLGAAPQAQPNMLAGGSPQGAPGGSPQQPPPSKEQLTEMIQRTGHVNAVLKQLLSTPDLSVKDVINAVGELVAEQVMDPFMAGKYLADLPADPMQVRGWVSQHYASSVQTLTALASMIQAHGEMVRRMIASQMPQQAPQMPSSMMPQGGPPPNMLAAHG